MESLFVLYRVTGDDLYRQWGKRIFDNINKYARVDGGFASLRSVDVNGECVAHLACVPCVDLWMASMFVLIHPCALVTVATTEHSISYDDNMESFFVAETLKYSVRVT